MWQEPCLRQVRDKLLPLYIVAYPAAKRGVGPEILPLLGRHHANAAVLCFLSFWFDSDFHIPIERREKPEKPVGGKAL